MSGICLSVYVFSARGRLERLPQKSVGEKQKLLVHLLSDDDEEEARTDGHPRPFASSLDGQPKSAICQEERGEGVTHQRHLARACLVIGEMLTALVISWTSINLIPLDRTDIKG